MALTADAREIITIIASVLTIYSYVPYFLGIYRRQVKPHVFTWFIWGLLTALAFFIQADEGGGIGSWVTAFTAMCCFAICIIALKHGEKNITRTDWIAFAASLMAIPVWLMAGYGLYSMIWLVFIDLVAFWPTIRKSWWKPYEESLASYLIVAVKSLLALWAFEQITLTIVLFPVAMAVMNFVFIGMVLHRRKKLGKQSK